MRNIIKISALLSTGVLYICVLYDHFIYKIEPSNSIMLIIIVGSIVVFSPYDKEEDQA